MSRLSPRQATEEAVVAPVAAPGPDGPRWGATVVLPRVVYDGGEDLNLTSAGDRVVLADSRILVDPDMQELPDGTDLEELLTVGARVTVRGQSAKVSHTRPMLRRGRLVYLEATLKPSSA